MLAPYRALLARPGAPGFVSSGFVGRLPMSMLGIGVVLLVSADTGSYGLAGAVAATLTGAGSLASPVVGRLADRLGQGRVVLPSVAAHALCLTALVALAVSDAPSWLLFVAAAPTGAALPPVGSMVRSRWASVLGAGSAELDRAFAMESVLDEVVFVTGPPLVTVLSTQVASPGGLVVAGAFAVAGGLAFAAQRGTEPPPGDRAEGPHRSAIAIPGLRMLVVTFLATGAIFGALDVSMVAFATDHGSRASAGWLLALVAAGSGSAGVWYGGRQWRVSLRRRFLASCVALAVGMVGLPLAPSIPAMAVACYVAGFAISPTVIAGSGLVERLVPAAMLTEGFSWFTTSIGVGVALGATLAGRLADGPGPAWSFVVCPAAASGAAVVALLGRRVLRTTW